jgi:hypothetical protein
MKNGLKALIVGGVLLAGASAPAMARDNVSFSVSLGVPFYAAPAYVAPAPVYYAPPPPVVYYRPAPAPVYYAPPAWGVTVYSAPGWRHHHYRGHYHR